MNSKYSYYFIMHKVSYIQSMIIHDIRLMHIITCTVYKFTRSQNMFLGLNFVNLSTTIAHVGNYSRLSPICEIMSLVSFVLSIIYLNDHSFTITTDCH